MKNFKKRVHFMGIGGSGMSGVALIAKEKGYQVTGCDLEKTTPYLEEVRKAGIPIFLGHDPKHLDGVDLLVVTPSVYFLSEDHPELERGKQNGKVLTWQEFLGQELHQGYKVICIAGTHGKSTTTAMVALCLERAGLDPAAIVGAKVKEWGTNSKVGKGKYFVTEADEFYDNFLNYHPDIIILNNIEFDHPDYFKSEEDVFESFKKFVLNLKGDKVLIFNQDDLGIKGLFRTIPKHALEQIKMLGYTISDRPRDLHLGVFGEHNVANALGVVKLASLLKIPFSIVEESLALFKGVDRRMDLIGTPDGVVVYDDYAHHPTAIKATLQALRQKYPTNKIWAIIEPHTYSRTKALLPLYKGAFGNADEVIIAPIFQSRDKENFGVGGESIVEVAGHKSIRFIDSFAKIIAFLKSRVSKGDVIIVMGAGLSYKLAREIAEKL